MTLRYPYEVRKEDEYFADIPDVKISSEMLKLAEHIVETKTAEFEPARVRRSLRGRGCRSAEAQAARHGGAEGCGPSPREADRQYHRLAEAQSRDEREEEREDQSAAASACDAESKEKGKGVMKDQITTLMEAVRLMNAEFDRFNLHGQGRDATLNAVEKILNDPKVTGAVASIAPLVDAPSLVPDNQPADA